MNITLSPQVSGKTMTLVKSGNILSINGEEFDFSPMVEGSTLPARAIQSEFFSDGVDMIDGVLRISLIFPIPLNYSPEQAFPEPINDVSDGPVSLPQPLPAPLAALSDLMEMEKDTSEDE